MRQEFVEVATIEAAQAAAPWAAEIVEVEGGFQAFESMTDYNNWIKNSDQENQDGETRQDVVRAVVAANLCCPEQVCDAVLGVWETGGDWRAELAQAIKNDADVAKQLGVE